MLSLYTGGTFPCVFIVIQDPYNQFPQNGLLQSLSRSLISHTVYLGESNAFMTYSSIFDASQWNLHIDNEKNDKNGLLANPGVFSRALCDYIQMLVGRCSPIYFKLLSNSP